MSEIYESKERPTPYPTAWAVRCPCCETEMEFEVQEDDSGAFGFDAANIPVCEPCSVMFFPETVQVRIVTECTTCGGTGKEGRHSICRDCDETPAPQTRVAPGELLEGMNYSCPCTHPSQCDDSCLPQIAVTSNGWDAIFCAPRDGTEILVWSGRRRHVASFDKVEGEWGSSFKTTTKRLIVTPPPTHWQHLPDGPEVEHIGVVSVEGFEDE